MNYYFVKYLETKLYGIYNRETIMKQLDKLPKKQKDVIINMYRLNEPDVIDIKKPKSTRSVGKIMGISSIFVSTLSRNAFDKLRQNILDLGVTIIPPFTGQLSGDNKQKIVSALGNYVFTPSRDYHEPVEYTPNNLSGLVKLCQDLNRFQMTEDLKGENTKLDYLHEIEEQIIFGNIPLEKMGLSARPYNTLSKMGITDIRKLLDLYNQGSLDRIRGLGKISIDEIKQKIKTYQELLEVISRNSQRGKNPNKNSFNASQTNSIVEKNSQAENNNFTGQTEISDNNTTPSQLDLLKQKKQSLMKKLDELQRLSKEALSLLNALAPGLELEYYLN